MKPKIVSEQQPPAELSAAPTIAPGETADHPDNGDRHQCTAVKTDGERCQAKALTCSSRCFFHDPESAGERIAASRRGGEKNRPVTLPPDTPDFPLANAGDASALIGRTINLLLRGEIDPKIANAVGYLVAVKMKAMDAGLLERRVAALELLIKD
jgi:hypothetical protein